MSIVPEVVRISLTNALYGISTLVPKVIRLSLDSALHGIGVLVSSGSRDVDDEDFVAAREAAYATAVANAQAVYASTCAAIALCTSRATNT
jgi:hypothetical protein